MGLEASFYAYLEELAYVEEAVWLDFVVGSVELNTGNADCGFPEDCGVSAFFDSKYQHVAFTVFVLTTSLGEER